MKKLQITSSSAEEIKEILKSKESYVIAARLVSILPLALGQSSRQAQELLLLSHNQICIWVKRFNEQGIEGLKDKPRTGRKPGITEADLKWLESVILNESPTKYNFNTETWTAPMIVLLLKRERNLTYSDDAVYIFLKTKLKLTHKKGKGFYREADPEKRKDFIETFKKKSLKGQ